MITLLNFCMVVAFSILSERVRHRDGYSRF